MKYTHFITVGDLNLPKILWKYLSTAGGPKDFCFEFKEYFRDCFWYQHITEPTLGRGDCEPSLIDLVFSNEEGMVKDVAIENPL